MKNILKSILLSATILAMLPIWSYADQISIRRPSAVKELSFENNTTTLINGRAGTIVFYDTLRIPASNLTGYSDTFQLGYVFSANADSNKIRMRFDTDIYYLVVKLDTLLLSATYDGDSVSVDSLWFEYQPVSIDTTWWTWNSDSTNFFAGSATSSVSWQTWRNGAPPRTAYDGVGRTKAWGYPLCIRTPGYYRFGVHTGTTNGTATRVFLYLICIPGN